jgi:bacterioferritin (cytochrome b1)
MVTFVGNQEDFSEALKELLELDYSAVDAYEAAIERLENPGYQQKLEEFKGDHERHIQEISSLLSKNHQDVPEKGSLGKQLLATGKVVLANMMGDNTILQAMKSNEIDTNTAYERMRDHKNKWPEAEDIISRGLNDEKKHKEWLESMNAS